MTNAISKAVLFAVALFLVASAIFQAFRTACDPVSLYAVCRAAPYFYFQWLFDYQSLVAALIALAGAWWGVSAIHRQIRQAEQTEQARLESKRAAARAVLPIALSATCDYAEDCVRMLQMLLEKCENQALHEGVHIDRLPNIPSDAFGTMKEMIEYARSHERDVLSALLETIQVQRSRISSVSNERRQAGQTVLAINLETFIVDAAEVYARASALFLFSRRLAEIPSAVITSSDVEKALHILRIYDDDGPIADRVKRQFPPSES